MRFALVRSSCTLRCVRGQRGDRKEQAEIDVGEYIPAELNTPVMEGLVLEMGSTQRNR